VVLGEVFSGAASPAQIAALAVALRAKGESVEEMTGFVRAMVAHAVGLGLPAAVDLGGHVAAVGEPELRAARVHEAERFDGRARCHHLQVDVLLPVVPGRERAVDASVHSVRHEVEDDLEVQGMGVGNQAVHAFDVAEKGVDAAIVADVVAEIGHR